jgi:hypothetical protein
MFYNARTWVEKLFWVLTFDKTSTLPIVIRISRLQRHSSRKAKIEQRAGQEVAETKPT